MPSERIVLNTKLLTVILAGLSMVGAFSIDTFLPSFPAIAHEYTINMAMVQQSLSIYLLAFSGMSLFYGTISDAFGRRRVILGSVLLYTLASAGAAMAPSFTWLLGFRALQGLSAGGGRVIGQAIIRDRFSGAAAQRMMSHVTMVFGLAPAIAPVIGGYLHSAFGWRAVFVFLTGLGLILLVSCYYFLSESLPKEARTNFHPATIAKNYWAALKHPRFVASALAVGFAYGGMSLYIASAASFVMHILHLPETAFAWLFVPMISGMVVGSAVGGKLAHRLKPAAMLPYGFGCMAVAGIANLAYSQWFAAQVPWSVLPLMLYTFGLGLILPSMTLVILDLFPAMRGLAASLISFIQMLIFSFISGIVAPLLFDSPFKLAAGMLVSCVLTILCWEAGKRLAK
jgi:DHA1 family bicyclomycin/chloramphenicol resistance-like MFS transporter